MHTMCWQRCLEFYAENIILVPAGYCLVGFVNWTVLVHERFLFYLPGPGTMVQQHMAVPVSAGGWMKAVNLSTTWRINFVDVALLHPR